MSASLVSCSTSAPPTKVTSMPVASTFGGGSGNLSTQIFNEVNSYRRSKGNSNLARHAGLDRLAQQHCEYLLKRRGQFGLYGKNVSHMGFESRALIAREKYNMPYLSENVASTNVGGANPAAVVTRLWMNSKGHENNMVNSWDYTGVGSVKAEDGTIISTQLFGSVGNSQFDSRSRFRMH
ncbi:MAG: CAP domain-containing protein [Luteolibacter sp.]